jgi:hypothetical protein
MSKIIILPAFKDGAPTGSTYDVCLEDYTCEMCSAEEFLVFIKKDNELLNLETCCEIKNEIISAKEKNIILPMFKQYWKSLKQRLDSIMDDYGEKTKNKFKDEIEEALTFVREKNISSTKYIFENQDIIFEILDELKTKELDRIKEKRKEINKRYYEKRKKVLEIPDRTAMTEEEKKASRKLANQKYREKCKKEKPEIETVSLTEKEKKQLYNKTYYEKKKLQKVESPEF